MQKFFTPIRDLAQKYNQLQSAIASAERIFQLLDTEEKIDTADEPRELPERPWHIEFNDVWFAYNDEEWVLRDVSFEVAPGEKVALVGHTGAGKSTVIRLLARLYDVNKGSITINGIDIREFDLETYREWFAVVLQDVFLFHGTIEENLRLGLECSDEKLREATEAVHADTIVDRYDDGMQHKLAERGSNLSSGEKQLISFARALLREPEVLILDEATANVDTETESLLQDAVSVLLEKQTSIAIAHRLSTIENSDRILVLEDGEIVERGSHSELVEVDGHYRTLYELQYAETPPLPDEPADDPAPVDPV
jgi:ABC-type multidrug transport system fused ATPase/permease subunit